MTPAPAALISLKTISLDVNKGEVCYGGNKANSEPAEFTGQKS
jgi:hypothetical protein